MFIAAVSENLPGSSESLNHSFDRAQMLLWSRFAFFLIVIWLAVFLNCMEIRFLCPSCGRILKADEEAAGAKADCPQCDTEFRIPHADGPLTTPQPESPVGPARDTAFANPNTEGALTCPVCWLRFDTGDIMHIAVHDSLRGDLLLGEDA